MEGEVVVADVVTENAVELFEGMDGIHIQAVYQPFFATPPESLDLLYEYSDKNVKAP